jgi:hypothetical protein
MKENCMKGNCMKEKHSKEIFKTLIILKDQDVIKFAVQKSENPVWPIEINTKIWNKIWNTLDQPYKTEPNETCTPKFHLLKPSAPSFSIISKKDNMNDKNICNKVLNIEKSDLNIPKCDFTSQIPSGPAPTNNLSYSDNSPPPPYED